MSIMRFKELGEAMIMYDAMIKACEESHEVNHLIELMKKHVDELDFSAIDVYQAFPADQLMQASPLFADLIDEADPRHGMTEFQASYAVMAVVKFDACRDGGKCPLCGSENWVKQ